MNTFLNHPRWGCEDENPERSDKALKQRQQFASDFLIVFEPGKPTIKRLEALERLRTALNATEKELEKQLRSDHVENVLKELFEKDRSENFNPEK